MASGDDVTTVIPESALRAVCKEIGA